MVMDVGKPVASHLPATNVRRISAQEETVSSVPKKLKTF
jgi:hypothetical protein